MGNDEYLETDMNTYDGKELESLFGRGRFHAVRKDTDENDKEEEDSERDMNEEQKKENCESVSCQEASEERSHWE